MKPTLIVYGSTTGICEGLAHQIAEGLGLNAEAVISAAELTSKRIVEAENLLLGTSTWGAGEVQDDWYDGLEILRAADLTGKTVAIFGCGDAASYADTFCGGMAALHKAATEAQAKIIGAVDASTYAYDDSEAVQDGLFVGLATDAEEGEVLTSSRVTAWLEELRPQL